MALTEAEAQSMGFERSNVRGVEWVHSKERCVGPTHCCIHNPSDHPLKDQPLLWRGDRSLMERICEHGVGHPDPDDLAYKRLMHDPDYYERFAFDVHGCCGCCTRTTDVVRKET